MIDLVHTDLLQREIDGHHEYYSNSSNKVYQGITSTLLDYLFPNQYEGISDEVLMRAAERGSLIHSQIEIADSLSIETDVPEVVAYRLERENIGLETIENEYIVSDFEHFASPIDLVMTDDAGNISLGDIKVTSEFKERYVSWQLSIYAYLFERQNLGLEVKHLFCVWIKGQKCQFIEVQRHSDQEVEELIDAYINGKPFTPQERQIALVAPDMIKLILSAKAAQQRANNTIKDISDTLQRSMEMRHIKSWENEQIKVTYIAPTEVTAFDVERFQKEHPELYQEYLKTTAKKASVRVTIR